ncbi:MAG TPA: 50S ribosomal protein L15 [Phycisphaerae bacterium]|jgi:large subunit ribosomal protein L15
MNLSDITKLSGAHKRRKRLGRGRSSGHGKTSGRGQKGAGSRSGWKSRGLAEGGAMPFFRRVPKRGFSNAKFSVRYETVNVGELEGIFAAGTHVTALELQEAGLIRDAHAPVKVLGDGNLSKKLLVEAAAFSKPAAEKIIAAGGQAKVAGAPA